MIFENDKPNKTNERKSFTRTSPASNGLVGKLPPQALDLEQAGLGALTLEKDALSSVIDIWKPEVFYEDRH